MPSRLRTLAVTLPLLAAPVRADLPRPHRPDPAAHGGVPLKSGGGGMAGGFVAAPPPGPPDAAAGSAEPSAPGRPGPGTGPAAPPEPGHPDPATGPAASPEPGRPDPAPGRAASPKPAQRASRRLTTGNRVPPAGLDALAPDRDPATGARVAFLWPQGAPGALGTRLSDRPSLLCFPAARAGDSLAPAVIVCPGGAYGMLALGTEGVEPARWLNELGASAFVLRYRLGPAYHHPVELGDARRALRWVRSHARGLGVDPARVAMLGFSAGGHLTALASCLPDPPRNGGDTVDAASGVPDLQMLIYPVISMAEPFAHRASRVNLLGPAPDPALLDSLSAERHVPAGAPPAFVVHAETDPVVAFANARAYADALRKAGVPVELVAFSAGGHAFGLARKADGGPAMAGGPGQARLATWPGLCAKWMAARGFLR